MRLLPMLFVLCFSLVLPVSADADLADRYIKTLQMDKVFEILRAEGMAAGEEIAQDGGEVSSSPAWSARLSGIYRAQRMERVFREEIESVNGLDTSIPALEFFETELGQRIVEIELAARRALADEATKAALDDKVAQMRKEEAGRIALYEDFIRINDLVESNVSGALNSNLAFYRGMATFEQFKEALSESFMLSTVWEQEPEIRRETESWILNFSALAYSTLSDAEMQQYIDLSATDSGQKLNAALFAGFDKVFEIQSLELGVATAEFSVGEDT